MRAAVENIFAGVCCACPVCAFRRRYPALSISRVVGALEKYCPFCRAYARWRRRRSKEVWAKLEERRQLFLQYGYDRTHAIHFVISCVKDIAEPVLDVGSGRGHLAIGLAARRCHVTSIDIDPEMLSSSRLHAEYCGVARRIRFLKRKAHRSGFAAESFGSVWCMHALHHFGEPYLAIEEMIRILRPGGVLVLSDFNEEGFRIVERVHARDGATHARRGIDMPEAIEFIQGLRDQNLAIEVRHDVHQPVLIVRKEKQLSPGGIKHP